MRFAPMRAQPRWLRCSAAQCSQWTKTCRAQARQILAMVLGEASWLAVVGVAVGVGAALLLTRFLRTMLFGLKPNDPATLICAGTLLFAVAILAGWVPARRAARVQPMQALRHE